MKKHLIITTLLSSVVALASCSFVSLNPEAKDITISYDQKTLSKCKYMGETNVSLWSKADTFQSQSTVDDQLNTLARNQAADMGGNVVMADSAITTNGKKIYKVYNCPANK